MSIECRHERGRLTVFFKGDIDEFAKLNAALNSLMTDSRKSFRAQKEFTENASHELQTPLAVLRSKLDILLQQPGITARQAAIIQDLYLTVDRMARLNRNLLLLAKMENGQFATAADVDAVAVIKSLMPYLENLLGDIRLELKILTPSVKVKANRPLMECMVGNLVVNAVRHNRPGGEIAVSVTSGGLRVANTSTEGRLDASRIFNRFYRPSYDDKGSGLGLAIVKAVCDYHGWTVKYTYNEWWHEFNVMFS